MLSGAVVYREIHIVQHSETIVSSDYCGISSILHFGLA